MVSISQAKPKGRMFMHQFEMILPSWRLKLSIYDKAVFNNKEIGFHLLAKKMDHGLMQPT